jgi:hypothetical protein
MTAYKPHNYEIMAVIAFPVIIGLDLMKKENISTGYDEGKKFLVINGTRIYLCPSMINEPLDYG